MNRFLIQILVIYLFFLICTRLSFAQEFTYKHYTVKDGLPQSQITALFEDSKGYLWVGTKMGLSRFDGINYKNYHKNDGLITNFICAFEESNDLIYILTKQGLCTYDYNSDSITPYPMNFSMEHYYSWNAVIVAADDSSVMILGAEELVRFKNGKYTRFKPDDLTNKSHLKISCISKSPFDNKILLSTNHGILEYKHQKFTEYFPTSKHFATIEFTKEKIICQDNDSIYGLVNDSLIPLFKINSLNLFYNRIATNKINPDYYIMQDVYFIEYVQNDVKTRFNKKFEQINAMLLDRRDNLWVGTEDGLYRLSNFAFFNYNTKNSEINPSVYSVIQDKSESYWFFAYKYGCQKMDNNVFKEVIAKHKYDSKNKNYHMGALLTQSGNILAPISNGFIRFEGESGYYLKDYIVKNGGTNLFIYEDTSRHLFYHGSPSGISVFDEDCNYIKSYPFHPGGHLAGSVSTIVKDNSGRIWFGGYNGLSYLQNDSITHLPNERFSYSAGGIATLKDHKGNIWLGTTEGLYMFDSEVFIKIEHPNIPQNIVTLSKIDSTVLFFGSVQNFGKLDLQEFYINNNLSVKTFDYTNGFEGIECLQNSMFVDSEKHLWIPTTNMVVKYLPEKIKEDTLPPVVHIESISFLSDSSVWKTLSYFPSKDSAFQLDYSKNSIQIRYSGIFLTTPERVNYKIKLEGYDKEWSPVLKDKTITYNNLPPREYTFKVKAQNADGYWSKPAYVSFEIVPAFWQTSWFYWLAIVLLISLVSLISFLVFKRIRHKKWKQMMQDKRIAEFKLQTIKNQIDPHFTFNALNSMSYSIMKGDKDVAFDHIGKLSKLVRYSLEHADISIRTLEEEIDFVENYLEIQRYRFENRFDYKFVNEKDVNMKQKVPKMLLQNHVENAVKHGLKHLKTEGLLKIEIKQNSNYIHIDITDNGIGRMKAKELGEQSTGKGLKTLQEFYNLFNQFNEHEMKHEIIDLYNENGESKGTKVKIGIPIDYKYEF